MFSWTHFTFSNTITQKNLPRHFIARSYLENQRAAFALREDRGRLGMISIMTLAVSLFQRSTIASDESPALAVQNSDKAIRNPNGTID